MEHALGTDYAGVRSALDALQAARQVRFELSDVGFVVERLAWPGPAELADLTTSLAAKLQDMERSTMDKLDAAYNALAHAAAVPAPTAGVDGTDSAPEPGTAAAAAAASAAAASAAASAVATQHATLVGVIEDYFRNDNAGLASAPAFRLNEAYRKRCDAACGACTVGGGGRCARACVA